MRPIVLLAFLLAASGALALSTSAAAGAPDCMAQGDAPDEPPWAVAVTLPLNCGGSIETRSSGFDEDWFVFSGTQGDELLIGQYASARANTLTLWSPNGTFLVLVRPNGQETVTLPESGEYRVVVEGNAGSYRFHLSRQTDAAAGTRLIGTGSSTPSAHEAAGPTPLDAFGLGSDASWFSLTSAATGHETLTADAATYVVRFYDAARAPLGDCAPGDASSALTCAVPVGATSFVVRDAFITAGPHAWAIAYHH